MELTENKYLENIQKLVEWRKTIKVCQKHEKYLLK